MIARTAHADLAAHLQRRSLGAGAAQARSWGAGREGRGLGRGA
ncbi:hypothetical protein [Streptomyces tauricus]